MVLDDLEAKQRNRRLLEETRELGAILEKLKSSYGVFEKSKVVTFSPSTQSDLRIITASQDNLNTPLPPEMSTVLKSDSIAVESPEEAEEENETAEEESLPNILSPRQMQTMQKASQMLSQSSSSSSSEDETTQTRSVRTNDAVGGLPLETEPGNHNLDSNEFGSARTTRTSKTTTKSSSRRSTQERKSVEFSSSVNSPRRSRTKSPSPFEKSESYKSESERVKTKTPNQESPRSLRISHLSSHKSSEKSSQKSSKHSSGIKLLEMSPRRMAPPSTTEQRDESTQDESEITNKTEPKSNKSSKRQSQLSANDVPLPGEKDDSDEGNEELWYQAKPKEKSPNKLAGTSWNALDNDDDSFSFD